MHKDVTLPWNMHKTIIAATLGLGGVGIFGAFGAHADLAAISSAWVAMFATLAVQAGKPLEKATVLKIVAGIMLGVGGFVGGVKLANTYFAYTGVGTVAAMIINSSANAALTYVTGRAAAQTFLSMDVGETVESIVHSILKIVLGHLPGHHSP